MAIMTTEEINQAALEYGRATHRHHEAKLAKGAAKADMELAEKAVSEAQSTLETRLYHHGAEACIPESSAFGRAVAVSRSAGEKYKRAEAQCEAADLAEAKALDHLVKAWRTVL